METQLVALKQARSAEIRCVLVDQVKNSKNAVALTEKGAHEGIGEGAVKGAYNPPRASASSREPAVPPLPIRVDPRPSVVKTDSAFCSRGR